MSRAWSCGPSPFCDSLSQVIDPARDSQQPLSGKLQPREWKIRVSQPPGDEQPFEERLARLHEATRLSPITLRVCLMRGLDTREAIQEFLSPRFESLTNPTKIRDMDRAVDRLVQA